MSEHQVSIVALDTAVDRVASYARRAAQSLFDLGAIELNTRRAELRQPSVWMPGPRWQECVEPALGNESFPTWANNGVDIAVQRQLHHPVANYERPRCGRCGAALDGDAHHATIDRWLVGEEPHVTCAACGWTALIGDWPAAWGFAVGAPAVVFNNWPVLTEEFTTSVRTVLAGRTFVVRTHL